MNYANYIKILLTGIAVTVLVFLLGASCASAQPPSLEVVFDPNPLFTKLNFLPGDSASGTVTVTNNSGETQKVITESINGTDPDELGSVLTLRIFEASAPDYYDGLLGDFLSSAGEVDLSPALVDGGVAVYTYKVTFGEEVEEYQDTTLGFDICIGFFDAAGRVCGDTVIGDEEDTDGGDEEDGGGTIPGSGGGGGGIVPTIPLKIENEEVAEASVPLGTALIEWDTNLLSTSQVVYGLASGTYTLNLGDDDTPPTYLGYPLWTDENPLKVTSHAVLLTGLVDGATYKFRVVSRASPPTVGFEFVFDFVEGVAVPQIDSSLAVGGGEDIGDGNGDGGAGEGTALPIRRSDFDTGGYSLTGGEPADASSYAEATEDREAGMAKEKVSDAISSSNAAMALFALPDECSGQLNCLIVFLIILLVLYLLWYLLEKNNGDNPNFARNLSRNRNLFFFTAPLITALGFYLFDFKCVVAPLLLISLLASVFFLWDLLKNNRK